MSEHNKTIPDPADVLAGIELRNRRLSILYKIALTVGKSLDLKSILDDALGKIIEFMGVDSGVIYVINEETLEMVPVTFHNLSDAVVRDLCENRVRVGECMCGNIADCAREVIIPERASEDPRFTRQTLRKEGMEFYAGLPLKAKGKVVGVLCAITHAPYTPDDELIEILRAATVPLGLAIENARMFESTKKKADRNSRLLDFQGIIATSRPMQDVLNLVRKVTDIRSSILVYGESGTGKELIARALHFNSNRSSTPFLAVNCAAIPDSLLESEFFGYVKGSFTGATSDKKGLFEAADGGTLFLDEVEAMSPELQAKLLRVLQDGTFHKVGGTKTISVDVRIIAATNRDLLEAVNLKRFREDLYYRLNVIRIDLPPLRARTEDIPLLARSCIHRFSERMGKRVSGISDDALTALLSYTWPGNIRELENALERAVAVTDNDVIRLEDLPPNISVSGRTPNGYPTLETVERDHIRKTLEIARGNKTEASRLLGIDKTTLWRKLKNTV